jgi:ketosteroid isomerase-like protein
VSSRNEMIVLAGIDAWNRDDWTALESQWAEEPSITAPEGWPEPGEFRGRDAVRSQLERLKSAWSDERIELIAVESAGDKVLIVGRWLGHGESSGLELDMTLWIVYTLIDGAISQVSFNMDEEPGRAEFEAD